MLAYFAYSIPIICLLCRGRKFDRQGTFQLGKAGWFVNIGAVCFMTFLAIFFCFPVYRPVTKTNMSEFPPDFSVLCPNSFRLCRPSYLWLYWLKFDLLVRNWKEVFQRTLYGRSYLENRW